MAYKTIRWLGGEVDAGVEIEEGTFTTSLENLYIDEQKQPNLMFSTKLVSYDIIPSSDRTYLGSFIGTETSIIAYYDTVKLRIEILVTNFYHGTKFKTYIPDQYMPERIRFTELRANQLKNSKNLYNVDYEYIILISGLRTLKYISGLKMQDFYITISVNQGIEVTEMNTVNYPNGCAIHQNRLYIICYGPNIIPNVIASTPNRLLASFIGTIDQFTTSTAGANVEAVTLSMNAFDALILCESGEVFLNIMSLDVVLVLTTTKGIRVVKSNREDDDIILSSQIDSNIIGYGDAISSKAVFFSSFLIFATKKTLRSKNVQVSSTRDKESIDMELPILTTVESDIIDISFNQNTQTIDCFLENGTVQSLYFQSQVPSASYPLSLPMSKSHKSSRIKWRALSGNFQLAEIGNKVFLLERSRNYGVLSVGAYNPQNRLWYANATDYNETDRSFIAEVNIINMRQQITRIGSNEIVSLWLCSGDPDNDNTAWILCNKIEDLSSIEGQEDDIYRARYKIDESVGGDIEGTSFQFFCLVSVRNAAYKLLPVPYNWEHSTLKLTYFDFDETNVLVKREIFYRDTLESFAIDFTTNKIIFGVTITMAIDSVDAVIGWREKTALISPLTSHKGLLVARYPTTNDLVTYTTNTSCEVIVRRYDDYSEISFTSSKLMRFREHKIIIRPKNFVDVERPQKYVYLLTE